MKVGGQWAGLEWNDPDVGRSERVQAGKPPPDRSWIEFDEVGVDHRDLLCVAKVGSLIALP